MYLVLLCAKDGGEVVRHDSHLEKVKAECKELKAVCSLELSQEIRDGDGGLEIMSRRVYPRQSQETSRPVENAFEQFILENIYVF